MNRLLFLLSLLLAGCSSKPAVVAPQGVPDGMVLIPAGTAWLGADDSVKMGPDGPDDRFPRHQVKLSAFYMDKYEVTNAQFAEFVKATGYKTEAEKPTVEGIPPGSIVFHEPEGPVDLRKPLTWWRYIEGANWQHPQGPNSSIDGLEKHPVVHVCYSDAEAYAKWAGKRLPTEAEWEYAARGGLDNKEFTWGSEQKPGGKYMANYWQGDFPKGNTAEDGYKFTAPVGSYPPNGYGLFDMAGNVWEWCSDYYNPRTYEGLATHGVAVDPRGPTRAESHDPLEPDVVKRVQRGGSFMCADVYCQRYRPAGRGKGEELSAQMHVGFRCVKDVPEKE